MVSPSANSLKLEYFARELRKLTLIRIIHKIFSREEAKAPFYYLATGYVKFTSPVWP